MVSWKQRFAKFLPILAEKWVLHQIHSWNTNLFRKLSCFIVGWKPRFAKFTPFLIKKCVLHQIQSWNKTLSRKLCFAPVWVQKSIFQNFHQFLLRNGFCIKSSHEIQLFFENCVLRYGELKTASRHIYTNSRWKMGFASNPRMEYKSFLNTVFSSIVGWKPRFAKFKPFLTEKYVLQQIHSWNKTFFLKLCFAA